MRNLHLLLICRFALAKFCTNIAHAAHVDVLVALGLDLEADGAKMQEWNVAGKSITLRMASEEHCQFLREMTHSREMPKIKTTTKVIGKKSRKKKRGLPFIKSTKETLVVTTVKDYYYKVQRESLECSVRETFKKS